MIRSPIRLAGVMGDPSLLQNGEFPAGECGDYLTGEDLMENREEIEIKIQDDDRTEIAKDIGLLVGDDDP